MSKKTIASKAAATEKVASKAAATEKVASKAAATEKVASNKKVDYTIPIDYTTYINNMNVDISNKDLLKTGKGLQLNSINKDFKQAIMLYTYTFIKASVCNRMFSTKKSNFKKLHSVNWSKELNQFTAQHLQEEYDRISALQVDIKNRFNYIMDTIITNFVPTNYKQYSEFNNNEFSVGNANKLKTSYKAIFNSVGIVPTDNIINFMNTAIGGKGGSTPKNFDDLSTFRLWTAESIKKHSHNIIDFIIQQLLDKKLINIDDIVNDNYIKKAVTNDLLKECIILVKGLHNESIQEKKRPLI